VLRGGEKITGEKKARRKRRLIEKRRCMNIPNRSNWPVKKKMAKGVEASEGGKSKESMCWGKKFGGGEMRKNSHSGRIKLHLFREQLRRNQRGRSRGEFTYYGGSGATGKENRLSR